ncbi:MAG: hypothetical protein PHP03_02905 [Candidatus Pacebacteria bacterium]|nr:hypothetical protein [Candidatus Paceibacterota bacterium]
MSNIPWYLPVVLYIVFAFMIIPFLVKKFACQVSRTRKLVWQYLFAALFTIVTSIAAGIKWNDNFLWVAAIGVANAFGCYCQWRAIAINLSVTSVMTWADDVIALGLGFVLLNETKYLNPAISIGLVGVGLAILLFSLANKQTRNDAANSDHMIDILTWVALYSVIWGVAMFSLRYFSLGGMKLLGFVSSWYAGSFFGSLIVLALAGKEEKGISLNASQVLGILILALAILFSLSFQYWAKSVAPLTIVQPIFQVSEMIFPTLIGLFVYKEYKQFNWVSWPALVLGLVGGLRIAFSFGK